MITLAEAALPGSKIHLESERQRKASSTKIKEQHLLEDHSAEAMEKIGVTCNVRCLEKLFGINEQQYAEPGKHIMT